MKKQELLKEKGFIWVRRINTYKILRTFSLMTKFGVSLKYIHANYETVGGSGYMSDLFAKDKAAETLFNNFNNADGRRLSGFLKKAKNVIEKYRLIEDRAKAFDGVDEIAMGSGGVGQVKIFKDKIAIQLGYGHGRRNYAKCAVINF